MFSFLKRNYKNNSFPELLILGAQKSGTTTLFEFLDYLPGFCGSNLKEVGFFTKSTFYNKGKVWYLQQFKECLNSEIRYEATPEYLYYPDVPKKIFSFNKFIKFIVIFREPSSRCYSAWNMFRSFNKNSADEIFNTFTQYADQPQRDAIKNLLFTKKYPSFSEAVCDDLTRYLNNSISLEPSFVRRGIYCEQLDNYLKYFSLDNFLFLEQKELDSTELLIGKISEFLKIEIDSNSVDINLSNNVGTYEETDSKSCETFTKLKDFYRPFNEKLFKQIGIRYDWND